MSEQNEKLRLVLEYRPDQKGSFVRGYDANKSLREDSFATIAGQIADKTPELIESPYNFRSALNM